MFDDSARWQLSQHQIYLVIAGMHAAWLGGRKSGATEIERANKWMDYRLAVRSVLDPFTAEGAHQLAARLIENGDVALAIEFLRLVDLVVKGKMGGGATPPASTTW